MLKIKIPPRSEPEKTKTVPLKQDNDDSAVTQFRDWWQEEFEEPADFLEYDAGQLKTAYSDHYDGNNHLASGTSPTFSGDKGWCPSSNWILVHPAPGGSDAAFVSIAGIDLDAPTLVDCFITEVEARELLKQGAVGEILCNFFNVEGELIDHELNDRNTSVKLKNQTNFHTISISGGSTKHQSLNAALHEGWLSALVTDEYTANALISDWFF